MFMIVAVESFRRQPDQDYLEVEGGSGGYPLLAEADVPIHQDLNEILAQFSSPSKSTKDPEQQNDIERGLRQFFQNIQKNDPDFDRDSALAESRKALSGIRAVSFRVRRGDDASCLNLYQATRPRILGVPQTMLSRKGFQFVDHAPIPDPEGAIWKLLDSDNQGEAIPAFVENNTAIWMLKKGLGDEIEIPNESGQLVRIKLVGLLKDSPFQSEILISDAHFRKLYPHEEGFRYFLIQGESEKLNRVAELLETGLAVYGFDIGSTQEKTASYLAVQNTYLTTFQLLGGFGVLLGVLGLAVILLRGVWERRGELALLRALGYRHRILGSLVLIENGFLLVLGLTVGIATAIASVLPHQTGQFSWTRLGLLVALIIVAGFASATLAILSTLRAPLIPALRKE
jgi:hypothetical protein